MTRDIYQTSYYRSGMSGQFPVKWMAPECFEKHVFDEKTDVWAYGVTLW